MKIIRWIPNSITCLNLICGCFSIVFVFNEDPYTAGFLILLAGILDFFDGFAARLLKVHSELGKQLDSLADMVSFGVAPGFILFHLLGIYSDESSFNGSFLNSWQNFIPFILIVFSAIRLAKFNLDTRQTDSFIGVPTPANALFIAFLPFVIADQAFYSEVFTSKIFLIGYPFLMSFLMVSEIPMFALKFKGFQWKGNEIKYIFLLLCLMLVIFYKWSGISFAIILYILLSIIYNSFVSGKKL